MASLFGMIKSLFGGGSSEAALETKTETQTDTETYSSADPVMTLQHDVEEVVESVVAVASTRADYVAEQAAEFVEETAASVSDMASDVLSGAREDVAGLSEDASEVGSGIVDAISGDEQSPAAEPQAVGQPLSDIQLDGPPSFINRDEFTLPRSEIVVKAVAHVEQTFGAPALAKGLRVYEYSLAAAQAYDWRVDRELLLLASLFTDTGADAGARASDFAVKAGMWDALAARIAEIINGAATAQSMDEPETRALSLGLNAEGAGGNVAYINPANAAETCERNAG